MMMKMVLALVWAVSILAVPPAYANLIVNGGFETGTFSGWTQGGSTDNTAVTTQFPHSGLFAARLGPRDAPGTLSQTVPTTVGATYTFSFWLRADRDFTGLGFFRALLNDVLVFSESANQSHPYQFHAFSFTGTGATDLRFEFRNVDRFFWLDDVEIDVAGAEVPEAATIGLALLGVGFLGVHVLRRRRILA